MLDKDPCLVLIREFPLLQSSSRGESQGHPSRDAQKHGSLTEIIEFYLGTCPRERTPLHPTPLGMGPHEPLALAHIIVFGLSEMS